MDISSLRRLAADRRDVRRAVLVAVVVVVVVATLLVVRRGDAGGAADDRSTGQTVGGFLLAQRDGDCERLIRLVTEATWSDRGRRSRAEFLEQCAEAVEGYDMGVEQVELETVDEPAPDPSGGSDRAVRVVVVGFGAPALTVDGLEPGDVLDDPAHGHLVSEDGEWKVAAGRGVLRIGRSVEQTVLGYVAAYNDGDCERLLDHLSDEAWSAGGTRDREAFVDQCTAAARARRARPSLARVQVVVVGVTLDGDDRATAVVELAGATGPIRSGPDTLVLVEEGLEWKLHGSRPEGSDDVDVLRPLPSVELVALQAQLLGEVTVAGQGCFVYLDTAVTDDDDGGQDGEAVTTGVARDYFGPCDDEPVLTAYRYADDDAARQAADRQAAAILADTDDGVPNRQVAVPGVPGGRGFLTHCGGPACDSVVALGVRGGVVVRVAFDFGGDPGAAGAILAAQLERL